MTPFERRVRLIAGIVIAVLALAAVRDLGRLGPALPWRTMDDFPDFYCAGWVLNHRQNPYAYEPMRACEHRVNVGDSFRDRVFANNGGVAVPAPLPPYDFLPFRALAQLPPPNARAIAAVAILASVLLSAVALALLGIPLLVSVAALALSAGFSELNSGQIIPFALVALALSGLALAKRNDRLAGIFAALTAVEPIVGVPVILAAVWFAPRTRWPVACTLATLAVLAIATVGAPEVFQYVVRVLPAQADSEVHFPYQYSLTYALAYLGFGTGAARLAGSASYAILLAVGLMLGRRAQAALGRRELLIFLPALCCVVAGPYVHQEELSFALPALLVLAAATRGPSRMVFLAALCVLSVPWLLVWGEKQLFLASALVCAVILLRLRVRLWPGIAAFVAIVLAIYAFELNPPHLPVPIVAARTYGANQLVQDEWRDYAEQRSTRDPLWFAIKIPVWAALLTVLAVLARPGFPLTPYRPVHPTASDD